MAGLHRNTLIKVLSKDRMPLWGRKERYPDMGIEHSVQLPLKVSQNGLHVSPLSHVWLWLIGNQYGALWECKISGERIEYAKHDEYIICTEKVTLIRPLHYSLTDFLLWAETQPESWKWSTHLEQYLYEKNR